MKIPQTMAKDIVDSMKDIINQDINYINAEGIIIASTDQKRVGDVHGGAKLVLEKNEEVTVKYDNQFEGSKKGINLPVNFNNEIVGVIGVTGSESEVVKYGSIIKKMTEILIKEAYLVEQKKIGRESRKQFVEEVLFLKMEEDTKVLKMRAELLGVRIDIPKYVVVGRIKNDDETQSISELQTYEKILSVVEGYFSFNSENLIVQNGNNYIMILDCNGTKDIIKKLDGLADLINGKFNLNLRFGIGSCCNSLKDMRNSYIEAKKALSIAIASIDNIIVEYEALDIDLILDDITEVNIKIFIDRVLGGIREEQLGMYTDILLKYIENDRSIIKTSDELFIHKNTLQYRLNNIYKITGYNPRFTKDLVVLYMAIKALRYKKIT